MLASPPDPYAQVLQREGFTWFGVDISRRGLNPVEDLRSLRALRHLYRSAGPDLVHHFTIKPVIYGSLAARLARVPAVVNSVTGLGYVYLAGGWQGGILRPLVWLMYRFALAGENTRVLFQNETDRQAFLSTHLLDEKRTVLIPGSGVDVQRFRPTPEPEGSPVAVLASRLLWDKGVGELVEAARILKARGVQGQIVLVGAPDPGNPASIPAETLEAWDREGIVRWLGHQEDMHSVYARACVVVLPSYREGLPKGLIEAAAAGRPVVATDVPGCRDVVIPGETGLLVPPRDPAALAEALARLFSNRDLRQKMGMRNRELAVRVYSNEQILGATIQVYADLLAGSGGLGHLQAKRDGQRIEDECGEAESRGSIQ